MWTTVLSTVDFISLGIFNFAKKYQIVLRSIQQQTMANLQLEYPIGS